MDAIAETVIHTSIPNEGRLADVLKGRHARRFRRSLERESRDFSRLLQKWIYPRLSYTIRKIVSTEGGAVTLQGGTVLKSSKLARALRGCHDLLCFIATIGPGVDDNIRRFMSQNRLTDMYALDIIGSTAIEDVVDTFHATMSDTLRKEGNDVSLRFSPGYCDWSVIEQKELFAMVDPARIDVTLLPSFLMLPRKSISGVFGIGADIQRPPYNPCSHCGKHSCKERRS
ncbi:MAG: hypothetical protein JRE40_10280 [Deltaproteobacteria bacterium]|nr:hypothetical protein [Deltaproteobacteria bacterium]